MSKYSGFNGLCLEVSRLYVFPLLFMCATLAQLQQLFSLAFGGSKLGELKEQKKARVNKK